MMRAGWCVVLLSFLLAQPALAHTVPDISGSGNNGTAHGCMPTPDGLMLNGTLDSYIITEDSPSLDLGGSSNGTLIYRVAFAADTLIGQPRTIGDKTLPEFVSRANRELHPDIVFTLGDCFEPELRYADQFVDIMRELHCPWVYVWGNHEQAYDSRAPIAEEMKHLLIARGVDAELRRYTYLDVDRDGKADFLVVIFPTFISEDDLTWFDSTFQHSSLPIIVLQHIPPITPHVSMRLPNAEEELAYIRKNGHVFAVFSCHDHGYVGAIRDNGTWYVNVRRTGSRWGVEPGYSLIDFYSNGSIVFYTEQFNHTGVYDYTILRAPTEIGFTVEIEATPMHLSAYNYLLDKGTAGNRNYGLCIKESGAVYAVSHDMRGEIWAESAPGVVSAGETVHAIMVANSTSIVLWVNGERVAERPAHPPYTTNDCPLYIGRTYSHPFNGTIKSVRIYNIPLSTSEVCEHFNGSYGTRGLVLHYEMGTSNESLSSGQMSSHMPLSASGPIYITSLPYEVAFPGYYILGTNLTASRLKYAVLIKSSGVVLDGGGEHSLEGCFTGDVGTEGYGIVAENVSNITIKGVELTGWSRGIYLNGCRQGRIVNSTFSQNEFGVYINDSHTICIESSALLSNRYDGIFVGSSYNSTVMNITAADNGFGVVIYRSEENTISNNTLLSNKHSGVYVCYSAMSQLVHNMAADNGNGISLTISKGSIVESNTFVSDGLFVWNSSESTVVNNSVNGRRLTYLEGVSDVLISGADVGQVILIKCHNITLTDLIISNTTVGAELWGTSYSTIENNTVSGCGAGIRLFYISRYNTISGNTLLHNGYAIYLDHYSRGNTIAHNLVMNCSEGIIVYGLSDMNIVENNSIGAINGTGIYVSHAHENAIVNNSLTSCRWGVYLFRAHENELRGNFVERGGDACMLLHSSRDDDVVSNSVVNTSVGIQLNHSRNISISYNTVAGCDVGISIYHSNDFGRGTNLIYLNNINCTCPAASINPITVYTNGPAVLWNTSSQVSYVYRGVQHRGYLGNHYGMYSGADTDADGVGDTPYGEDFYPLVEGTSQYRVLGIPPVPLVSMSHLVSNVGSPTYLSASFSYDPDGAIVSYEWDFGDGTSDTGVTVSHTYSSYHWNGSYYPFSVGLTVTDDRGATNSTSISVVVFMAGDANGDGVANILDASLVGLHWNARYGSPSYHDGADLNNDDVVNILDAAIVGLNWNRRA